MPIPNFKQGDLISDRYRVIKQLGKGGIGTVYCTHDTEAGTRVAVKLLDSTVRDKKDIAARVHQEIRSAYGLNNEYVTSLYSVLLEDDYVGLVLEYVEGRSLYDLIVEGKNISIQDIVVIGRQVALGLKAIHAAGIIHRDIKPENIILSTTGIAKIIDFGVSILTSTLDIETFQIPNKEELKNVRVTATGAVMGTLPYIPPEYLVDSQFDERADIYALGLVLYELTTLQFPYDTENNFQLIEDKVKKDPSPPSTLRAECPEWLDKLILTAMCRDPKYRYQTAEEVYKLFAPRTLGLANIPTTNIGTADLRANFATARRASGEIARSTTAIEASRPPIEESRALRTFLLMALMVASFTLFYRHFPIFEKSASNLKTSTPKTLSEKTSSRISKYNAELQKLKVKTSGGHRVFSGVKAPSDTIVVRANKRIQ